MSARIEVLHEKVDKLQQSFDLLVGECNSLANVMDNLCMQVQSQNVVLGDIENMIHTIYEGRDNG